MSDRVNVQITATDGASRVFSSVANAADNMEKRLDAADKAAGRFSKTGAALGAAVGTIAGIMADSARAAAEADISAARLAATFEAAGTSVEEWATQLEAAGEAAIQMGFDDEEAADSIARLTQATGDAGASIENLSLIMDVARGRGISLADATRIVEAAELGRIGTLARLGIVLDENATKEEALAALQQRYAGQAEAYSNTTAGAVAKLRVELGNAQEELGAHAGSIQTLLVLLPGLSAGYTAVAAGLGGLVNMLGLSNKGMLGLAKAGGPLLAVTAAVAGLHLLLNQTWAEKPPGFERNLENAQENIDQITEAVNYLSASGDEDFIVGKQSQINMERMLEDLSRIETLQDMIQTDQSALNMLDVGSEQYEQRTASLARNRAELERLVAIYGDGKIAAADFAGASEGVYEILINSGVGAQAAIDELDELNTQFRNGDISAGQYLRGIEFIAGNLNQYNEAAITAADATEKLGSSFHGAALGAAEAEQRLQAFTAQVTEFRKAQLVEQFNAVTGAYTATTDALSAGFRVIVGNTNAIAQQSQAVADWATALIDVEGTYSKLDDLLQSGSIDLGEYNAAQQAHNTILLDNAMIQEDILSIQAQSAPILAGLMADQARYVNDLASAAPDQQLLALAYMDTATAAQALSLAQAAMSDTPGLEGLIEGAMIANPLLQSILEDMGIIKVGADGQVNILVDGQSELQALTDSINALVQSEWIARFGGDITAAEEAYNTATGLAEDWDNSEAAATISADNTPAIEGFNGANSYFTSWDGSVATATANLQDNASGPLGNIAAQLQALNGQTATTYVTTVYGTAQKDSGLGGVQGYAQGGVVARMGEWGTETLRFPGGGIGFTSGDGLYNVPRGTLVTPHTGFETSGNAINLTVNIANANNAEDIVREIVPALQRAIATHQRGY